MDENEILKNAISNIRKEREEKNKGLLDKSLNISKQIVERDYQLDNSSDSFVVVKNGERFDIVQKGDIYYLHNPNIPNSNLFYPSKEYSTILKQFEDLSNDEKMTTEDPY